MVEIALYLVAGGAVAGAALRLMHEGDILARSQPFAAAAVLAAILLAWPAVVGWWFLRAGTRGTKGGRADG